MYLVLQLPSEEVWVVLPFLDVSVITPQKPAYIRGTTQDGISLRNGEKAVLLFAW